MNDSKKHLLKFSHLVYWYPTSDGYNGVTKINSDWAPIIVVPLLATVILAASIFLLVIFRQNPTFVISTVAACLIFVTVYLTIAVVQTSNETYA